jgi:hypothetical protein
MSRMSAQAERAGRKRAQADPSPAETQLLAAARELRRARVGWRAVHFHLSRLQSHHRRDTHLQIAANMLDEVVQRFEGRLFVLGNCDIVLLCRGARRKTVEGAVQLIRYLFNDDPLSLHDEDGSEFCSIFDLEADYERFLALAQRLHDAQAKRLADDVPRKAPPPPRPRRPLDPAHLGEVLGVIARADLTNVMRRQAIWSLVPGAAPQPLGEELFVSIEELGQALAPDYHLGNDRWLFQYLTQALDRRVLSLLSKDYPNLNRGLSLNVNVATLLSPEFLNFEEHLPIRARGNIMLELQLADIWSDFGAYLFAANLAKQHGHRLILDGVKRSALPMIDSARLGLDFVKLVWDDGMLALEGDAQREFRRGLAACAPARVILMRCERAEAVSVGQAAGIALFQGWTIDRLARSR